MKRTAAAGTFALLAGGATLLLLASIFYSCRGGGQPHDMGTSARDASPAHVSKSAPPKMVVNDLRTPEAAPRLPLEPSSPAAL